VIALPPPRSEEPEIKLFLEVHEGFGRVIVLYNTDDGSQYFLMVTDREEEQREYVDSKSNRSRLHVLCGRAGTPVIDDEAHLFTEEDMHGFMKHCQLPFVFVRDLEGRMILHVLMDSAEYLSGDDDVAVRYRDGHWEAAFGESAIEQLEFEQIPDDFYEEDGPFHSGTWSG